MQVIIHKSSELPKASISVINDKIKKLETYYDRIERAEVFVKEDDGQAANGHTVEVRLAVPGNDLFAEHTDESIERAIDKVSEALRRQLKKHKEKNNDHHANKAIDTPPMGDNDDEERIILSEEQL